MNHRATGAQNLESEMSTEQVTIVVEGMSCGHCEQALEKGLSTMPGVQQVKADHARRMVSLDVDSGTPIEPLKSRIKELGYQPIG